MPTMMPLSSLSDVLSSTQHWLIAVLGIGMVVFVHEFGHFIVAKRSGVRVEIFSLGFGPRLFGKVHGDTDYRLSLIPIGGYVKMAGDNLGDQLEGDSGELPSKSVGQRFAIFSAGVGMNLLFALLVLPIVLTAGVLFNSTVIGGVTPGSPAWQAGLLSGDEVLRVGGHPVYDFNNIIAEVAVGNAEGVTLEILRTLSDDSTQTLRVELRPEYDETVGYRVCGLQPSIRLEAMERGAAATAGMRRDDRTLLLDGKRILALSDYEPFLHEKEPRVILAEVEGPDGSRRTVAIQTEIVSAEGSESQAPRLVGIRPLFNRVKRVRGSAEHADIIRNGDELLELVAVSPGSVPPVSILRIRGHEDLRLALEKAASTPERLSFRVRRREQGNDETLIVPIPARLDPGFADDISLGSDPDSTTVQPLAGYPAEAAGLPNDATILRVNGTPVSTWKMIQEEIQSSEDEVYVLYSHEGVHSEIRVIPRIERHSLSLGLLPVIAKVPRSFPIVEAIKVGTRYAVYMLKHVYLTLKSIFRRDVSPRNLSGIITIAYVSRSLAESGVASLLFFLAVLSLNLAFVNLLPIPILDGGHLLFLIVEKIKGSPVSDRVVSYSQLVGFVMVIALLLYVTYNDLLRVF